MAFTNKYPGSCGKCGKRVAAGAGLCEKVNGKFTAFHKSCGAGPRVYSASERYEGLNPDGPGAYCVAGPNGCVNCGSEDLCDGEAVCPAIAHDRRVAKTSTVFRTSGGAFYRNARGRCEDAPCCGCCTF